jgi:lipoyl(octanoyl) transferase
MIKSSNPVEVINLGRSEYRATWDAMRDFTHHRQSETPDQLWLTEHPSVFTQGLNGRAEHVRDSGDIPLVQVDRGGQVTYHGPGQLIIYCLLDLNRLGLGVKGLVALIEQAIIDLLNGYGIDAHIRAGAPGVYVEQAKIAALGLRIRKGYCYHGLSLNVDMELEPFNRIDPCGYRGLAVTQLCDLGVNVGIEQVGYELADVIKGLLSEKESGSTGR